MKVGEEEGGRYGREEASTLDLRLERSHRNGGVKLEVDRREL